MSEASDAVQGKVDQWKMKMEAKLIEIITKEAMNAVKNLAADCMKMDNVLNPMSQLGALAGKATALASLAKGVVDTAKGAVDKAKGAVDKAKGAVDKVKGAVDTVKGAVEGAAGGLSGVINTVLGAAGAAAGALGAALAAAGMLSGGGSDSPTDSIEAAAAAGEAAGDAARADADAAAAESSEGDSLEEEASSDFISLDDSADKLITWSNKAETACKEAELLLREYVSVIKQNYSKYWIGSAAQDSGIAWIGTDRAMDVMLDTTIYSDPSTIASIDSFNAIENKIDTKIQGKLAQHISGCGPKIKLVMNDASLDDDKKKPKVLTEIGYVIGDLTYICLGMKEILKDMQDYKLNDLDPAISNLKPQVQEIITKLKNPLAPGFGLPYDKEIETDLTNASGLSGTVQSKLKRLEELVGNAQEQLDPNKKPSGGEIPMCYWNLQQETNKIPKSKQETPAE